eukprot:jgi/Chrpa1/12409/Chrysochromulina_OHIO_Genome00000019-RA
MSEAPTDEITRLQSTVRSQAAELRSQAAELRRARIEATASAARLEALGTLIKQQQQLASELQIRLMGAKLPQPALAMPDPPKPADVASTASAHLDAAQASLAQCVLSLAAGGTSDSPASVSKRLPPPPSDADASDSEGVDEVDDLSIRLVAALRACSSLKQMVPLAEAAAVQRCDEQRARHQAASERVSRSEAEARRLLTETHQLRASVRLLREQLKAAAHSHATELTVVHSEMRQLRLALSTALRRPKPNGLVTKPNGLATPATSRQHLASRSTPAAQLAEDDDTGASAAGLEQPAAAMSTLDFLDSLADDQPEDAQEDATLLAPRGRGGGVGALGGAPAGPRDEGELSHAEDKTADLEAFENDRLLGAELTWHIADEEGLVGAMLGASVGAMVGVEHMQSQAQAAALAKAVLVMRAAVPPVPAPLAPAPTAPFSAGRRAAKAPPWRGPPDVMPTGGSCLGSDTRCAGDAIDVIASRDPAVGVSRRLLHGANLWGASS